MLGFLFLVAILEILAGVIVFATASSAIHEILGTLMGGFGVMTIALAGILEELRKGRSKND